MWSPRFYAGGPISNETNSRRFIGRLGRCFVRRCPVEPSADMPTRSPTPCTHPNCPKLVRGASQCAAHRTVERKQADQYRGSSHSRGYGSDWQAVREKHLNGFRNQECAHCRLKGRRTPAWDVDHIIPHSGRGDPKRLDPNNLQTLCKSCHATKTAKETIAKRTHQERTPA